MSERDQGEYADEVEHLYLAVENILDLFADRFGCSVADAADQLRNKDGLASAVDRPRMYAHYQGRISPYKPLFSRMVSQKGKFSWTATKLPHYWRCSPFSTSTDFRSLGQMIRNLHSGFLT